MEGGVEEMTGGLMLGWMEVDGECPYQNGELLRSYQIFTIALSSIFYYLFITRLSTLATFDSLSPTIMTES